MSELTDLEIVRACAKAIGLREIRHPIAPVEPPSIYVGNVHSGAFYNPLKHDEQAMALVKRFRLQTDTLFDGTWTVESCGWDEERDETITVEDADLNRAICECVSRLAKGR